MKASKIVALFLLLSVSFYAQGQTAEKVIKNATIYTADTNDTFVEALAISNGIITYAGSNSGVETYIGAGTTIINAGGRLLLPGLQDVHMHPLEASSINGASCVLNSSETNPENYIAAIQVCSSTPNSNGWVLGWGHSIYTLLNATRAPRLILDEAFPTTPALFMEETSHSMWINTAGLNALGITDSTPDPVGGHIIKSYWGTATDVDGILLDNAGDAAIAVALATNSTLQENNYDGLVNYGLPLLAQNGITAIAEGRTYWKQNYIETWQAIKANNLLTCRVSLAPWIYPDDTDVTQIPTIAALYDTGDDLLKIRQIKLYSDGIIINATAALHAPYNDNLGFPFTTGLNYITETRMTTLISALEQVGYDFHIHAIGDRGITESLNAISAARTINGDLGARHRVTHLETVQESDFSRFVDLNVTADMQVTGSFTNPENWHENDPMIGSIRSNNLVPLKSIYDTGARVTLSSDWDVSSISPFVGIQNSLTRTPQNLPTVASAVKAYTINAAYVLRQENTTGSLEVGKYADFVVLDRDIFTIPHTQIGATTVVSTWLAGTEIYSTGVLNNPEIKYSQTQFEVYPTITEKLIHLYYTGEKTSDFRVGFFDTNGKEVQSYTVAKTGFIDNEITLDASEMSEGVYLLKFTNNTGTVQQTKKIIIRY